MRKILFLLLILISRYSLFSQKCPDYEMEIGYGDRAKNEVSAYNHYELAEFYARRCGNIELEERAKEKKISLFKKITDLKKKAEEDKTLAENLRIKAEQEKENAEISKRSAEYERKSAVDAKKYAEEQRVAATAARDSLKLANETNQKIVAASYFYQNKYALAYQNGKYGFIDKTGEPLIPYTYDHALPFDETLGWALVKKAGKEYYVDTSGAEYLLVRDLNYLDNKVSALDLSNRDLKAIPAEVLSNKQLKYVNLSGNQIEIIPSDLLDNLTSLVHLDVSNNQLKVLPVGANELPQLKTLNISHNQFSSLSTSFERLIKLEELNLSDNLLTELPESIQKLQALKVLDVSENKLNTLPAWVGQLQQLTKLYLQNNELRALPDEISKLKNVRHLNLSFNLLSSLPEAFGNLDKLEVMDISFNKLEQITFKIRVQNFFNCSGNQLVAKPEFVNQEEPKKISQAGNKYLESH